MVVAPSVFGGEAGGQTGDGDNGVPGDVAGIIGLFLSFLFQATLLPSFLQGLGVLRHHPGSDHPALPVLSQHAVLEV